MKWKVTTRQEKKQLKTGIKRVRKKKIPKNGFASWAGSEGASNWFAIKLSHSIGASFDLNALKRLVSQKKAKKRITYGWFGGRLFCGGEKVFCGGGEKVLVCWGEKLIFCWEEFWGPWFKSCCKCKGLGFISNSFFALSALSIFEPSSLMTNLLCMYLGSTSSSAS